MVMYTLHRTTQSSFQRPNGSRPYIYSNYLVSNYRIAFTMSTRNGIHSATLLQNTLGQVYSKKFGLLLVLPGIELWVSSSSAHSSNHRGRQMMGNLRKKN